MLGRLRCVRWGSCSLTLGGSETPRISFRQIGALSRWKCQVCVFTAVTSLHATLFKSSNLRISFLRKALARLLNRSSLRSILIVSRLNGERQLDRRNILVMMVVAGNDLIIDFTISTSRFASKISVYKNISRKSGSLMSLVGYFCWADGGSSASGEMKIDRSMRSLNVASEAQVPKELQVLVERWVVWPAPRMLGSTPAIHRFIRCNRDFTFK